MLVFGLLVVCALTGGALPTTPLPKTDHELIQDLQAENAQLKSSVDYMRTHLVDLTRQVMLQQTFVEERIRSDGSSGLKQVRNNQDGTRPYFTADHTSGSVAGIHEHSSNIRTIGMGELNVVLNGVEFRTRHNDYQLKMPVTHDKTYNKLVDIPYPDVPPEVLSKPTVAEQVNEMKEWFKAFKNQDHSVRDYRKYFKPVLCYMEGGWTTNTQTLEEPFFSDRHHIDASSWFDLQDKLRFTSYSGGKSNLENFAYLPTTIMNVVNGTPEYAQWNYRIACHPLKNDLPLDSFVLNDEVSMRMQAKIPFSKVNETRGARFSLKYKIPSNNNERLHYHDRAYHWGLLDDLMYEIPGKDNYGAFISDDALGLTLYDIRSNTEPLEKINTAQYHRWYKVVEKDAMGNRNVHRGFSDPNLFAAQTTNPKISGLSITTCHNEPIPGTHRTHQVCQSVSERYTWAIPLEIIYMTPLQNWNPYNIRHVHATGGRAIADIIHGPNGTRNGMLTTDKAYNGTHDHAFYRIPEEMFSSTKAVGASSADTAKGVVGVLDPQGVMRRVVSSGFRIILPDMEGVGRVRIRYPIMPLHAEGEQTRKELEALKDMVMKMPTYSTLFEEEPSTVSKANAFFNEQEFTLRVSPTTRDPPGLHDHTLVIHQYDIDAMKKGQTIHGILTSVENGHQHSVDISMDSHGNYIMASCDGMAHCWDGHDNVLHLDN